MEQENDDRVLQGANLFFYGATGECVTTYRKRFNHVADIKEWNAEKKRKMLLLSLRGDALNWYLNTKEALEAIGPLTYEGIMTALVQRFETPNNDDFARLQLNQSQQEPDETMSAYAARIQGLGMAAFPNLDYAMRNQIMVAPFLQGLYHDDVRRQTLAAQPTAFAVAFWTAQTLENSLGANRKQKQLIPASQLSQANSVVPQRQQGQRPPSRGGAHGAASRGASSVASASAAIDQRTYQHGLVQGVPARNQYMDDGSPICNYCHKPYHMAWECCQRERDQRNSQQQPTPSRSQGLWGPSPQEWTTAGSGRDGGLAATTRVDGTRH